MYSLVRRAAVLVIVFDACPGTSIPEDPRQYDPYVPYETSNRFFGSALHHLTNITAEGDSEMRRNARNYLRATTDMRNETIRDIERGKYPFKYNEKPLQETEDLFFEKQREVDDEAQNLKQGEFGAKRLLDLVLEAHEDLSDLAKGSDITDLTDAKARSTLKNQFGEDDYGNNEWHQYLELMRRNEVIDEDQFDEWTHIQDGPTRRSTIGGFLKGKLEGEAPIPIKVLWDYGLPGWFQVEMDFMKTYIKLFNGRGRSGAKVFGAETAHMAEGLSEEERQKRLKKHYGQSLESLHEDETSRQYHQYAQELNPQHTLVDKRDQRLIHH